MSVYKLAISLPYDFDSFFLFNTEPDSVKLTAEGDLTYFYKQEEVNSSSKSHISRFYLLFFFSSEHEYIVLEFF